MILLRKTNFFVHLSYVEKAITTEKRKEWIFEFLALKTPRLSGTQKMLLICLNKMPGLLTPKCFHWV